MNQVIFYMGSLCLTWHGVIMALAVLAAVVISVIVAGNRRRMRIAVLTAAALGCIFAFLLSKLVYWYCCYERFNGLGDALRRFDEGGHSLVGAIAGVVLAALVSALIVRPDGGFMALLDCIAPGGALGICIGRLAAWFTLSDKGNILITEVEKQHAPIAYEIIDSASGTSVWRFATFFFEAAAAAVIFVCCAYMYYTFRTSKRSGSVAVMFFSLFGASQAVLESTRYDALYLRSNGFVSLMQIAALLMIIASLAYFSLLAVRRMGVKPLYYVLWGTALVLLGICGMTEYFVQRYADKYIACYAVMSCAMAMCVGITIFFCILSERTPDRA